MYNMANLDLGARPEFNGFAGKDWELFLSTGVLECWQKRKSGISTWIGPFTTPLLHHFITPADCRKGERPLKSPQRVAQSWGLQAGFVTLERYVE